MGELPSMPKFSSQKPEEGSRGRSTTDCYPEVLEAHQTYLEVLFKPNMRDWNVKE